MNSWNLEEIRENEKLSHTKVYSSCNLYEEGSWLSKPIKTIVDIVPLFCDYRQVTVLDLGCGVGRNAIYIAKQLQGLACTIDCVDILPLAIEKLYENAKKYRVSSAIKGIVGTIDDYVIEKEKYDLVLAISALEHMDTIESFKSKLSEIAEGVKENGIVGFVINTEVEEKNKMTGEKLTPQFEVNISTADMSLIIADIFSGWKVLKQTVVKQNYEIPRKESVSCMNTNVVTFVARKEIRGSGAMAEEYYKPCKELDIEMEL